jgi:hypothetical protein
MPISPSLPPIEPIYPSVCARSLTGSARWRVASTPLHRPKTSGSVATEQMPRALQGQPELVTDSLTDQRRHTRTGALRAPSPNRLAVRTVTLRSTPRGAPATTHRDKLPEPVQVVTSSAFGPLPHRTSTTSRTYGAPPVSEC